MLESLTSTQFRTPSVKPDEVSQPGSDGLNGTVTAGSVIERSEHWALRCKGCDLEVWVSGRDAVG